MKKTIVISMILALAAGMLGAQVVITSPLSGMSWEQGTVRNVTWNFSGITDGTPVKLVLFRGGTAGANKIGNIVQSISVGTGGHGTYAWTVGDYETGKAPVGTDYWMRVIDMSGIYKADGGPFAVTEPQIKGAGPLEGSFAIDGVTFTVISNAIENMSILVSYSALNDFRICAETAKCHPEFGSMFVQYTLTNYEKKDDQIVSNTQKSCVFACKMGCGEIEYPQYTLKKGTDKFWLILKRLKPDKVWGVDDVQHSSVDWMWPGYDSVTRHEPEVEVTLTMCVSKLDPPNSYSYKLVPVTFKAKVADCKLVKFESGSSGWF
jgi:hypothetical protein